MFNNHVIASVVDIHGITNFTQFYIETSTYKASLRAAYGGTPSQVPEVYANESALGNEYRFMHTPVMMLHGTDDDQVNVSQSRYLNQSLSALGYTVKYIEVPGATHDALFLIRGRENEILDWFNDHPLWQAHLVQMSLTVQVYGNGMTNSTGTTLHNQYDNITVLATPDSSYYLHQWLLNGSDVGSTNPYTINMTSNYNLTAVFLVTVPYDITGPGGLSDGKVDAYDLTYIGEMFGTLDLIADFTGSTGVPDGIVDTYELAAIGKNFGLMLQSHQGRDDFSYNTLDEMMNAGWALSTDEYHIAVARDTNEAKRLVEAGVEYVCTHVNIMLFRKSK
jgi:hypothetical protein